MPLFGRTATLQKISSSTEPVLLIVGDSGVGKTAVLRECQRLTAAAGDLAPGPVRVRQTPAALQNALLEGLGAALASTVSGRSAAERIARNVLDAIEHVRRTSLKALTSVVGNALLDLVASHLGGTAAAALRSVATEVASSADYQLAARIRAASDPDVIDTIISLADEARRSAKGPTLFLALDDVDRLDETDRRRLGDLVERLPDGIRIRATFTVSDAAARALVDDLIVWGASALPLRGLSEPDVTEWLTQEGLPTSEAAQIRRITGGYPLYVEDVIRLLSSFDPVATLDPNRRGVFAARTRRAWDQLDPDLQRAVGQLAPFTDALIEPEVQSLLGVDAAQWGSIQRRLLASGFFLDEPQPWFHHLRRLYVYEHLLTEPEHRAALENAHAFLDRELDTGGEPRHLIRFAQIVAELPSLAAGDPHMLAASNAAPEEVAVAAALLELEERTHGRGAVIAEPVLLHARAAFNTTGDLVAALERLTDAGLVYVAANETTSAVVGTWGSIDTRRIIAGRAAAELGRLPIPEAASHIFESVLRPAIEPFDQAQYGAGRPRLSDLAKTARRLTLARVRQSDHPEPTLLVRAWHHELPLYAAITYSSQESRDDAATRLRELRNSRRTDEIDITDITTSPDVTPPSGRFLLAAGTLFDRGLTSPTGGRHHRMNRTLSIPLEEEMAIRTVVLDTMSTLCDEHERLVYGLDEPLSFAFDEHDSGCSIVEISGCTETRRIPGLFVQHHDKRFERLRLAERIGLARRQRLGPITWRGSQFDQDPTVDEIQRKTRLADAFADHQYPRVVPLNEDEIARAIVTAETRRISDCTALSTAIGHSDDRTGQPTTTFLTIRLPPPGAVWPWSQPSATAARVRRPADEVTASVRIQQARDEDQHKSWVPLSPEFGIAQDDLLWTQSHGSAQAILAELLGYRERDLDLRRA